MTVGTLEKTCSELRDQIIEVGLDKQDEGYGLGHEAAVDEVKILLRKHGKASSDDFLELIRTIPSHHHRDLEFDFFRYAHLLTNLEDAPIPGTIGIAPTGVDPVAPVVASEGIMMGDTTEAAPR